MIKRGKMLREYIPILIIFGVGGVLAIGMLALNRFLGPRHLTPEKLEPFECGWKPAWIPRQRFAVKFYIIAIFFVIFDIEAVFLYPWAVLYKKLGILGFFEMFAFLIVLGIALVYVWKKGALEWE
jgi:NADH-quinone oxidoreductase subunit A